jgi:hypothetical protein
VAKIQNNSMAMVATVALVGVFASPALMSKPKAGLHVNQSLVIVKSDPGFYCRFRS